MAKGDVTLFNSLAEDVQAGVHNFKETHIFKLGLVDGTITPTAADELNGTSPRWSDYSANDVDAAGNYVADGVTLTYDPATRWDVTAGVGKFDADDVEFAQDASGFTNARWGIIYNDTDASDRAIGFVDLGGDVSEQDGPVKITWNAAGIATITVNPA